MTPDGVVAGSFRDPAGFVFVRDGILYRQVNESYGVDYQRLMGSGLYEALVDEGLLVSHSEVDAGLAAAPGAYAVLRPERVEFVSYPYEWCFGQWRDAALATLRIQTLALDHGMSLRDASAYNIQFRDGRPVLIDTLSFEALREGMPWAAYRQFCQHFLAPLALMSTVDPRLGQLARVHIDGVPLDLASGLLPRWTRLRPGLLVHLHSHARSQRRHAGRRVSRRAVQASLSPRALRGLVDSLTSAVEGLRWQPPRSAWSGYYTAGESYSAEAAEHKRQLVTKLLTEFEPDVVWDLGANTGLFSRIAVDAGARTVAFDSDHASVQAAYEQAHADRQTRLLPLVMDLTNPSPGLGWRNRERQSLAERGPADVALALALVHHLAIGNNVPLVGLAEALRALCRWLIVEFVPKSDPMVSDMLAVRDDVFPDYTPEGFEAAFGSRFVIERREPLRASERTLYLMRGR